MFMDILICPCSCKCTYMCWCLYIYVFMCCVHSEILKVGLGEKWVWVRLVLTPERRWITPEQGKVKVNSDIDGQIVLYTWVWKRKTNRTISQLIPSAVSLRITGAQQLCQVKRMIGGSMLFSTSTPRPNNNNTTQHNTQETQQRTEHATLKQTQAIRASCAWLCTQNKPFEPSFTSVSTFKTSPCMPAPRAKSWNTCVHGAGTHGGVLDGHMGVCERATHTTHATPQPRPQRHTTTPTHNNTNQPNNNTNTHSNITANNTEEEKREDVKRDE